MNGPSCTSFGSRTEPAPGRRASSTAAGTRTVSRSALRLPTPHGNCVGGNCFGKRGPVWFGQTSPRRRCRHGRSIGRKYATTWEAGADVRVFEEWREWGDVEKALRGVLPEDAIGWLGEVCGFAVGWHGGQVRPAGEPYVEHLLETAEILREVTGTGDREVLAAGLLHDVVEDTACTLGEVEGRFGGRVAELVGWVTKPEAGDGEDPAEVRIRYLERFASAPVDVVSVKLADRYSNVQRLHTHPRPAKRRSYYAETCRWFLPLAARVPEFEPLYREWRDHYREYAS
ncbi:MAG: HD domain-containing protein [Mycobacteriales bacterium]